MPLRFVVLFDSPDPARWAVETLSALLERADVEFVGVVGREMERHRGQAARRVYETWRRRAVPALRPTDARRFLRGVQPLTAVPEGVDFALDLRVAQHQASAGAAPRHGVWRFEHPDPFLVPDPLVRDRARDSWGQVRCRLLAIGPDGRAAVLRVGYTPVVPWSYARTLDAAYCATTAFPAQACFELLMRGPDAPPGCEEVASGSGLDRPGPSPVRVTLRSLVRLATRLVTEKARRLVHFVGRWEDWRLAIVPRPIHELLDDEKPLEYRVVSQGSRGRYLADPFGIPSHDRLRVVCEEYDYRTLRGTLVSVELDRQGRVLSGPRPVRARFSRHVSFPYLFRHEDEWFCLPETHQERRLTLWRTDSRLESWHPVGTLLDDVALVDPVVFRHAGKWWLMATPASGEAITELHLWHAEELLGAWSPHPLNPVKVDVGSARCAGAPFRHGGNLYRPAQDCSGSYGSRVVIHRVDVLSPTDFAETPVAAVEPDPNSAFPDGLHTLSAVGDVTLIDLKRHAVVPIAPLAEVFARISRRIRRARGP